MDFKALKENTIKIENLIQTTDGMYRYVNHSEKILTSGYTTKGNAIKFKNNFRFDEVSVKEMYKRYSEVFPERI